MIAVMRIYAGRLDNSGFFASFVFPFGLGVGHLLDFSSSVLLRFFFASGLSSIFGMIRIDYCPRLVSRLACYTLSSSFLFFFAVWERL